MTFPVGFCSLVVAGALAGVTVAIRVTTCPGAAVPGLTVSVTESASRMGVRTTGFEVLVAHEESPQYTAVRECETGVERDTPLRLALFDARGAVPSRIFPS